MSLRTVLPFLAALGATACGASYQRIYEGDVRFEHCYRLDADPTLNSQTRLACWSEWLQFHTPGQTQDRVVYARRREASLRSGDLTPAGPTLITGQEPPAITTQRHALTETSAPTGAKTFATPTTATSASNLSSRQTCAQECGQGFTACVTRCNQESCVQRCGTQAKVCLDSCL